MKDASRIENQFLMVAASLPTSSAIYSDSPIGKIKRSIQERDYVLLYPYTDRACYDELKEHGIEAEVYELDDEITTIGFLRNLNDTYDEISDEIDSENNEL